MSENQESQRVLSTEWAVSWHGAWYMEEYENCGCTFVAKRKKQLLGYCGEHGYDRNNIYRVPKNSVDVGAS